MARGCFLTPCILSRAAASVLVLQASTTGLALLQNHVDLLALFGLWFGCFVLDFYFFLNLHMWLFLSLPVLRMLLHPFSFLSYFLILAWPFLAQVSIAVSGMLNFSLKDQMIYIFVTKGF